MNKPKIYLMWNIILTICLIVLSVTLVGTMDKVDVANRRVLEIENGLSSVELYLEPEYHRYLRGEITALWEEIHDLKARIKK